MAIAILVVREPVLPWPASQGNFHPMPDPYAPPPSESDTIAANLAAVRERIAGAARATERDPAGVTLVIVSKTQAATRIAAALAAGHRVFGENRVQEAAAKWPDLRRAWPGIELHLVGP